MMQYSSVYEIGRTVIGISHGLVDRLQDIGPERAADGAAVKTEPPFPQEWFQAFLGPAQ